MMYLPDPPLESLRDRQHVDQSERLPWAAGLKYPILRPRAVVCSAALRPPGRVPFHPGIFAATDDIWTNACDFPGPKARSALHGAEALPAVPQPAPQAAFEEAYQRGRGIGDNLWAHSAVDEFGTHYFAGDAMATAMASPFADPPAKPPGRWFSRQRLEHIPPAAMGSDVSDWPEASAASVDPPRGVSVVEENALAFKGLVFVPKPPPSLEVAAGVGTDSEVDSAPDTASDGEEPTQVLVGPSPLASIFHNINDFCLPSGPDSRRRIRSSADALFFSETKMLSASRPGGGPVSFGSVPHLCLASGGKCRPCMFEKSRHRKCRRSWLCDFCHLHVGTAKGPSSSEARERPVSPGLVHQLPSSTADAIDAMPLGGASA